MIGRRSLVLSALLLGVLVMRPVFMWLLRSAQDNELRWSSLTMPASFVIGSIASYWMIDRIAGFWS